MRIGIFIAVISSLLGGARHAHAQAPGRAGLQIHAVPRLSSSFGPRHNSLELAYGLQLELTSEGAGFFAEANQWARGEPLLCVEQIHSFGGFVGASERCPTGPPVKRSVEGGLAVHPAPSASHQPFVAASMGAVWRDNGRTQTIMGLRGGVDVPTLSLMRLRLEFTHHRTVSAPLGEQTWYSTVGVGLRFSHRLGRT